MARFSVASGTGGNANTGDITFSGIEIIGAGTASGDGEGNGTIELVPDASLYGNDQYLIIDPTNPNHIHIRAGGTQDDSNGDLILGGEKNNVYIEDDARKVSINTRPATVVNTYTNLNPTGDTSFVVSNTASIYVGDTAVHTAGGLIVTVDSVTPESPSAGLQTITANLDGTPALFVGGADHTFYHEEYWTNYWEFRSDGVLTGPAMGGLWVQAISGKSEAYPLGIYSPASVVIDGSNGAFLDDETIPLNQIATIGDIADTVSDVTSYNPVWSGTGLAFTGTPAAGSYVKVGSVVTVQIDVEFDNVSNFGTGQYSLTLPFSSRYHTDTYGGSIHNVGETTNHYSLKGHLSPSSNVCSLWYIAGSSQDQEFDHNSPISLNTNDKFHMSFTYICE